MNEVINVEQFFKSHQVHLSRDWLESCINWCKTESLPPQYTLKDLQHKVFDQWLLLDLRDVEIPCLPPNLSSKEKDILKGIYTLQLLQVVDISKPKFWQLQRIRNGVPKNLEQELESSKRVLQFTLTDGVQEVEATEFRSINCLNLNLSPGLKIRLMGPIQVRRGRLLLEEKNVKIIGGEVDTILVSNAAENILAKHLNQPLNPNPEIIQENRLTANMDMFNEAGTVYTASNIHTKKNLQNQITCNTSHTKTVNYQISQNNLLPKKNIQNEIITLDNFDDDFEIEHKQHAKTVNNQNNQGNLMPKNNINQETISLDDFGDDFDIEQEQQICLEVERILEMEKNTNVIKNASHNMFNNTDLGFESFNVSNTGESSSNQWNQESRINKISDGNKRDSLENKFNLMITSCGSSKQSISHEILTDSALSIWPIDKLVKAMPNISNQKFIIKAKFKKVVEKLTIKENSFHLVVGVEDESGEVSLKFHCDVITELIGRHSVDEFIQLKEEWSKNNVEAKNTVLKALECLKNRLIDLNDKMKILVSAQNKFPILLQIL